MYFFLKILREDKGVETKLCLEERAYFAESKTIMVKFVLGQNVVYSRGN